MGSQIKKEEAEEEREEQGWKMGRAARQKGE
jgi:hypothetical protein